MNKKGGVRMFTWVKGNVYTLILTLYPSNITLNSSAAGYFEDVRWCMIGIDAENSQLGIRPREIDLHLVEMDQLHKISLGKGYARITNKAIMEEIALLTHQKMDGLKVNARFDEKENMLIADLKDLINKNEG